MSQTKIELTGNLVAQAEIVKGNNIKFRMGVREYNEPAFFMDVVLFGGYSPEGAEEAKAALKKGAYVQVGGRIRCQEWSGNTKLTCIADTVILIDKKFVKSLKPLDTDTPKE